MRQIRLLLTALALFCAWSSAGAQTWFPAVDDNFARANTSFGAAGTTNVGNPTLGPASGWIDSFGNVWRIQGNVLQGTAEVGGTPPNYDRDWLLRPASEAALSSRIVVTVATGNNTGSEYWLTPRYVDANNFYLFYFRKGGAGTTTQITLYSYSGGVLSSQLVGSSLSITWNAAHVYTLDCSVSQYSQDPGNTCILNAVLTDVTAATSSTLTTIADSTASLQAAGRCGLSVSNTGVTDSFTRIQTFNSPQASVSASTSAITLSATLAGGAYFPTTAQWYRSTSFNFTPGAGNLFGAAQTISSAASFANVTDSSAALGTTYFYKCVFTDSQGTPQTLTSAQLAGTLYSAPTPIVLGFIGDSTYGQVSNTGIYMAQVSLAGATGGTFTLTYNGATTSALAYNATSFQVASALGFSSNSTTAWVSGPTGGPFTIVNTSSTSATAKMSIASSLTGTVGTVQISEFTPIETTPSIVARLMQTRYGIRATTLPLSINSSSNTTSDTNRGLGGTTTGSWASGGTNLIAAKAAFAAAGVNYVLIDLGINDGRNTVANSTATYQTNLSGIVTDLVGAGYKVILNYPMLTQAASGDYGPTAAARQQGYQSAINAIVTSFASSNPGTVFLGDTKWWQYACLHPTTEILTPDGVHPNAIGARVKSELIADRMAQILNMLPGVKRRVQ